MVADPKRLRRHCHVPFSSWNTINLWAACVSIHRGGVDSIDVWVEKNVYCGEAEALHALPGQCRGKVFVATKKIFTVGP